MSRWVPPMLLFAVVAWEAFRESGPIASGDVFWHLRTGDLVFAGGPPREDMFSWTAGGETWRPNAWLGDAVWATVRSITGAAGVSLLAGAAVFAIAFLLFRAGRRRGAGPWAAVTAAALTVFFLAPFIVPRPLLIGLVLLPIAAELAARVKTGNLLDLGKLALVMVLWSNLHGSFVVGVATVGLIAAGWAFDKRTLAGPIRLVATVFTAGLINPYGIFSYLQAVANRAESTTIEEWQPLSPGDGRGILLVLFMGVTAFAAWRSKEGESGAHVAVQSGRWETLLPLLVLALATFQSIRIGSFFLVVAAPLVALGLTGAAADGLRRWARPRAPAIIVGLAVAAVILAIQQVPELRKAGDPGPLFSESLVAAIPTDCRLLNEYDLGDFIIDRRWPDVLVSQDGQADLYGLEEIRRQDDLLNATEPGLIDDAGVECVLADSSRPVVGTLTSTPEWRTIAESSRLVLLQRS